MATCGDCRFWSQMCAMSNGDGDMTALCLATDGPKNGKFTRERFTCPAWKSNHLGQVDDPPNYGEFVRAAYEAEEAA